MCNGYGQHISNDNEHTVNLNTLSTGYLSHRERNKGFKGTHNWKMCIVSCFLQNVTRTS